MVECFATISVLLWGTQHSSVCAEALLSSVLLCRLHLGCGHQRRRQPKGDAAGSSLQTVCSFDSCPPWQIQGQTNIYPPPPPKNNLRKKNPDNLFSGWWSWGLGQGRAASVQAWERNGLATSSSSTMRGPVPQHRRGCHTPRSCRDYPCSWVAKLRVQTSPVARVLRRENYFRGDCDTFA